MSAPKKTEAPPPVVLSRFKEAKAGNPFYLAKFWKEHEKNFKDFTLKLLEQNTLIKLSRSAKEQALKYNFQSKRVPDSYNSNEIKNAYEAFESSLSSSTNSKEFFVKFISTFFEILSSKNKKKGQLDDVCPFFQEVDNMRKVDPYLKKLLGDKYDKENAIQYFLPQLPIYFVRFFDIYDASLKGELVDTVLKKLEQDHKQEHVTRAKLDGEKLRNVWNSATNNAPMGPSEPFVYDRNAEPSNPLVEEQLENLSEAYFNRLLDLQALYNYKGKEFEELWSKMTEEERKQWINIVRENIRPSAEMGLVFCPELNAVDLSKDNGNALLKLMQECKDYTQDVSQLDSFTSKIALQLKSQGKHQKKDTLTIIYSRRFTLCSFMVNMIFEVLQLGQQAEDKSTATATPQSEAQSVADIDTVASQTVAALGGPFVERDKSNPLEKTSDSTSAPQQSVDVHNYRKCSNPTCPKRESDGVKFNVCGSCKKKNIHIPYCSRSCQQKHWSTHKLSCAGTQQNTDSNKP